MDLSAILKDKDVIENFASLVEKHELSGRLEFEGTRLEIGGFSVVLDGKLSVTIDKAGRDKKA